MQGWVIQSSALAAFLLFTSCSALVVQKSGCPRFLDDYAAYHRENKDRGPRYLVYHCIGGATADRCGGLGDRMRGMLFLFRLAIATRRILLLKWTYPVPLEALFRPSLIDWRTDNYTQYVPMRFEKVFNMPVASQVVHPNGSMLDLSKENFEPAWGRVKVVTAVTNMFADAPLQEAPHLNDRSLQFKHCLFRYLFLFSQHAEEEGKNWIKHLFQNAPYPAAHLRLGHSEDEQKGRERGVPAVAAVACVRQCSANLMRCSRTEPSLSTPLLVVTDHTLLRHEILGGKHQMFSSLTYNRTFHMDYSSSRSVHDHITTVVELYMLAHASSLVTSRSGFSDIALWHSGMTCFTQLNYCNCTAQG